MFRKFAQTGRSPVVSGECAVATSHSLATVSAINVLKNGGNAVDAALAASATLCVAEPQMTGVGGDCFAIVAESNGTLHGLNGSGRSAAKTSLAHCLDMGWNKIPEGSAQSITVPGAVNAWQTLHNKFGKMDWKQLFADAISYAENGMPVAERVAADWSGLIEKLSNSEGGLRHYLKDGNAPGLGDVWKVPALAKTLRAIADGGSEAFYFGEIARDIALTVQDADGFLSEEDLASVSADWVDLISAEYRGHTIYEIPPNTQGLAALLIVKLLERSGAGVAKPDSVARAHLEAECGRIGYAARNAYISDPDTLQFSVEELLSDQHLEKLSKQFDPQKRNDNIELPNPSGSDTVYLSVVDRDGMAVSFINSIFSSFGSGIVTDKTGITLHNRGCGFSLEPGHANVLAPGKRPFHTIIPAMATKNGKVTHSFGVMGGSYQAMGQAHVISSMLDYQMNPQQALDDPRIFWDEKGHLQLEDGISDDVKAGLEAMGHTCTKGAVHGSGQIIQIDHERGVLIAGSDGRKDSQAAGY